MDRSQPPAFDRLAAARGCARAAKSKQKQRLA